MTVVIGGVYQEQCHEPAVRWTYGSGTRGAVVLGESVERFVTAADEASLVEARSAIGRDVVDAVPRSHRIGFSYDTPLSRPHLTVGEEGRVLSLPDVQTEDVVVYGTIERVGSVRARRAIVDPQHSLSLAAIASTVDAEELVVVANTREVRSLADDDDIEVAVHVVRSRLNATAVVVKGGAAGAVVVTADAEVGVPAWATPSVFPIGSGDVFTAGIGLGFFDGLGVVEAARLASERTAGYCATRQLGPVDLTGIRTVPAPTLRSLGVRPRIYVAASFATPEQRWAARTVADGIHDIGGEAFYPLRDVGPVRFQSTTAEADLAALAGCEAIIVLTDSARSGPHFEAGWATHAEIPVVVATSDPDPSRFTMLRGTGAAVVDDWSSAAYHVIWQALIRRAGSAA